MVRQRRRDTKPELAVRRALHARGWRYRVDRAPLPGLRRRADVLFPRHRVAVYVDGCFWHSCPDHATTPKTNTTWWQDKLAATTGRDRDTDQLLETAGWHALHVWEHEAPADAVSRIESQLASARAHRNLTAGETATLSQEI